MLEGVRGDVLERGEWCPAGRHGVHIAQEPVGGEVVALAVPAIQVATHGRSRITPLSADLRQGEVSLGQLRATGVDPVEDLDDDVHGLVCARDLLDVKVTL